jgi:hypothetical protein
MEQIFGYKPEIQKPGGLHEERIKCKLKKIWDKLLQH